MSALLDESAGLHGPRLLRYTESLGARDRGVQHAIRGGRRFAVVAFVVEAGVVGGAGWAVVTLSEASGWVLWLIGILTALSTWRAVRTYHQIEEIVRAETRALPASWAEVIAVLSERCGITKEVEISLLAGAGEQVVGGGQVACSVDGGGAGASVLLGEQCVMLPYEEITALLVHELAHITHHSRLLSLVALLRRGPLRLLTALCFWTALLQGTFLALPMILALGIGMQLVISGVSRRGELHADRCAVAYGLGEALIALLERSERERIDAHPEYEAALERAAGWRGWFLTHPPTPVRARAARGYEAQLAKMRG